MTDATETNPRRWTALVFISLAKLMSILDATIMTLALPSAQRDLGISDGNRQWVITAYILAFGGLLLVGGRISDVVGHKRVFVIGLLGFAGASVVGSVANGTAMLLGARALQGAFAALLTPATLSLLTGIFAQGRERAKAFGIYAGIASSGEAIGLVVGGALTGYLNWRWSFYITIPVAVIAAVGASIFVTDVPGSRSSRRLHVPGALLATGGLVALVYGLTCAESDGWTAARTLVMFAVGAILLAIFGLVESRTASPLIPLRVVAERNRAGIYLSLGLAVIASLGLDFFLTYYFQTVKGWDPVATGLAFLPMSAGMIIGSSQIGARLMSRLPPRMLIGPGFLVAVAALLLLTQLDVDTPYASVILPAQILFGLGSGVAFMTAVSLATYRIDPRDIGAASAILNTAQNVGGSVGIALLNTIAASATTSWLANRDGIPNSANEALVHGYVTGIWWSIGILVLATAISVTFITAGRQDGAHPTAGDEHNETAADGSPTTDAGVAAH
ncbi:MFS transporter [Micromonospora sp. DT4]|uniref:MFS transporter n=1 Tax=Micromonospora sp. DT4 TaxID=3393438 RepID=UPI003CE72C38